MEEVPDIINFMDPDGVPVLDKFCFMLEDGGYGTWNMIKKALQMQSGSAAVIKGRGTCDVHSRRLRRNKAVAVEDSESEQPSLFEEDELEL